MNRRTFLKLAGAAAIAGTGGLLYCSIEPYWLRREVRRIRLKNPLLKNIRILHVTDLHIGNRQQFEFAEKSLMAGLAQNPDLICMTGDFINRRLFDLDAVAGMLSESGVVVLRNEHMTIQIKGQFLTLVGIDDVWSGSMDVEQGFRRLPSGETPRIVLAHNPDMKESLKKYDWDLMLCGHTHGGQVEIPGFGALVLPVKDRRFIH